MSINEQDILNDMMNPDTLISPDKKPSPFDSFEYINRYKVDLSKKYEETASFLDVIVNDNIASIATLENFTLVIGKPKCGKTFLVSLLAASFLKQGLLMGTLKCEENNDKPKVLIFDTEQSEAKVQQVGNRICRLAELDNDGNVIMYFLRSLSPKERLLFIEKVIYNTSNFSLVIIDGIRDLVSDINSQSEATEIASKLLKWTAERNIHLLTVLHQNKADFNARGHLGTELVNKAETVMSITASSGDSNYSLVEPVHCREKPFTPFAFQIDDNGMPFIMKDFIPNQKGNKKTKLEPQNYGREIHEAIDIQIFTENKRLKYRETVNEIQNQYQIRGIQFGQNKAKDFLNYLTQTINVIGVSKEGNSVFYYSNLV
jgi:hypothetical protein